MSNWMLSRDPTPASRMAPLPKAAGALLHPVTLMAIAVLLLNDHVFKHVWPGTWWTGKLSDIAWMVFALPALALILALVVPRTPRWSNRVFAIAYVGLALLYLAYNLNEALHDVIMAAFAVLTKAEYTSPFDPTDAIVIPPALALAAWVWHRGRKPPQFRRIPALAVVTVAGLASVATSYSDASYGIVDLAAEEEALLASVCFGFSYSESYSFESRDVYTSSDGGLTWAFLEERSGDGCQAEEKVRSVETERGLIQLRPGEGVFLVKDGVASLEVDTSFMDDSVVQALTYEQLSDRGVFLVPVSLGLFDMEVAPSSENVVVAAGHNGVLVGMPDGSWEWVSVGPYAATSQSPDARFDLLNQESTIYVVAVAGFLGAAIPFLLNAIFSSNINRRPGALVGLIAAVALLPVLVWIWGVDLRRMEWRSADLADPIVYVFLYGMFIAPVTALSLICARPISRKTGLICAIAGLLSSFTMIVLLALWVQTAIPSLALAKGGVWIALLAISAMTFFILRRIRPRETRSIPHVDNPASEQEH